MARESRKKSESGFYCISCIGNCVLFKDDDDYEIFKNAVFGCGYNIAAYALMPKKAYFIIEYDFERLGTVIQSILIKYAKYYNGKYGKNGKLFYDRYKSCPLEYEEDITDAVRFLNLLDGETSARDYIEKSGRCNTDYVFKISENFMEETNVVKEIGNTVVLNKFGESENVKLLTGMNAENIKKLPKTLRDEKLAILKKAYSIRRIEKLTGISRGIIFNAQRNTTASSEENTEYWML